MRLQNISSAFLDRGLQISGTSRPSHSLKIILAHFPIVDYISLLDLRYMPTPSFHKVIAEHFPIMLRLSAQVVGGQEEYLSSVPHPRQGPADPGQRV
jgi:hypothetical protein